MTSSHDVPMAIPLAQASLDIQLAVELILLLEQQNLPTETVIKALEIALNDFKQQQRNTTEAKQT